MTEWSTVLHNFMNVVQAAMATNKTPVADYVTKKSAKKHAKANEIKDEYRRRKSVAEQSKRLLLQIFKEVKLTSSDAIR
ncbi:hypothetical protein FJT64_015538 [Amphibalanus amphitrite]|uniref:Uncharacterized protein n=1 Tax=Amphibalanus amphitrite TaxID=1232801 RepID=A0A6A4X3T7_AMPAM|nr:hypothetical protein FJT64_015538 [Amphibalanus amphitrite]